MASSWAFGSRLLGWSPKSRPAGSRYTFCRAYGFSTSRWSTQPPRKKRWRTIGCPSRKMRPTKMASKRNFTRPTQGDGRSAGSVVFEISVIYTTYGRR